MTQNAKQSERLGLPVKPFMYTFEQIASLFSVDERMVTQYMIFYLGRSVGAPPKGKLRAINLADDGEIPIWRVTEKHLTMYLKAKGIRFYTRGYM